MTLLIVGSSRLTKEDRDSLSNITNFAKNSVSGDVTVLSTALDELIFDLADDRLNVYDSLNQMNVSQVDIVFIRGHKMRFRRDQTYYLSQFCLLNKIKCINSYESFFTMTKFSQGIIFLKQALPQLNTIYSVNKKLLLDQAEKTLGYPYILKDNTGSHGDSNYLIENRAVAQKAIDEEPKTDFLAQQYCPNICDYRLLIMGKRELIFKRQGSPTTHLNNVSKGASAVLASDEIPTDIITKAQHLAKTLHLNIAGVDIIPNSKTGQLYFLEINSQPQLRTGAFLEEKKQLFKSLIDEL